MQWATFAFADLTPHLLYGLLRLRQAVFIVEQHCVYLDSDNLDLHAIHMLCTDHDELLAYQRCLAPGLNYPDSSLGRIVVSSTRRNQQLGRELVQRGIDYNLSQWPQHDIRISAQAHLQAFYASLGFIAQGCEYLEDGILHRQMYYPNAK